MWCTIINGVWFVFAAMICVFAGDFHVMCNWLQRIQKEYISGD
jgi:hypothetical protein